MPTSKRTSDREGFVWVFEADIAVDQRLTGGVAGILRPFPMHKYNGTKPVQNWGGFTLGNSGVYFITCECFGAKFVKVGRSNDVATRRRELQSGCPFELVIEYVQTMDEKDSIKQERRYRTLFRTLAQQLAQDTTSSSSSDKKRISRWFPFTGEIEVFVQQLNDCERAETSLENDRQALLF